MNKLWQQIKLHKKCVILLVLEFLVFLFLLTRLGNSGQQYAFSMTEVSEDGSYYVSTEVSLPTGVYQLLLNYHADSDMTNVVDIVSDSAPYQSILSNNCLPFKIDIRIDCRIIFNNDILTNICMIKIDNINPIH